MPWASSLPLYRCDRVSPAGLRRAALTLLELVVVAAVLVVLSGLVASSVQHAREAARRADCSNTMRQCGLATHSFESAKVRLPDSGFRGTPGSSGYVGDWAVFAELIPFFEGSREASGRGFENSIEHQDRNNANAAFLQCSSGFGQTYLTSCAETFSGDGDPRLSLSTIDYAVNGGYVEAAPSSGSRRYNSYPGPTRVRLDSGVPSRLSGITDGLSNTVLQWESVSGQIVAEDGRRQRVNGAAPNGFSVLLRNGDVLSSRGKASSKTFLYGLAGIGISSVDDSFGARVLNVTNVSRTPYSNHPGGVNCLFADGSVRFLSDSVEREVFISQITSYGRD